MKTLLKEKPGDKETVNHHGEYFSAFKNQVYSALETYANVHRGSGQKSLITTRLYEHARAVIANYLQLDDRKHVLIFATAFSAEMIKSTAAKAMYKEITSDTTHLALGVHALALNKSALRDMQPGIAGGGTARLTAPGWVIWEKMPELLEAGTPAVINVVAFAVALQMQEKYGADIFLSLKKQEVYFSKDQEYMHLEGEKLLEQLINDMPGRHFSIPGIKEALPYINLDNSASTPAFLPAWESWSQTLQPDDSEKKKITRKAENIIASFVNAPAEEYKFFFTSNTTEGVNLAARIINNQIEPGNSGYILSSFLEHTSNDLPWRLQPNLKMLRLNCDDMGLLDPAEAERMLKEHNQHPGKEKILWIAVTGASNVHGIATNIPEITRIAHAYGAKVLIDAAQLIAHRPVDMAVWDIDALVFSGHKVYAPFGTGALIMRRNIVDELSMAHTTENFAGIAALGTSLQLMQRVGMELLQTREQALTRYLMKQLSSIPGVQVYGMADPLHPAFEKKLGVMIFQAGNKMPFGTGKALAAEGIGIRVGCHCAHIIVKKILGISQRLEKLQKVLLHIFPKLKLQGVARISLGIENTKSDIQRAVRVIKMVARPKNEKTEILTLGKCKKRDEALVQEAISKVFLQ